MTGQASSVSTVRSESGTYQATPLPVTFDCWWEYKEGELGGRDGIVTRTDPEDRNDWVVYIGTDPTSPAGLGYFHFLVQELPLTSQTIYRQFSRYPDALSESFMQYVMGGDYVELFWQQTEPGFTAWWNVWLAAAGSATYWEMVSEPVDSPYESRILMDCGVNGAWCGVYLHAGDSNVTMFTDDTSSHLRLYSSGHFWQVEVDSAGAHVTSG